MKKFFDKEYLENRKYKLFLLQTELHVYGSSRLGIYNCAVDMEVNNQLPPDMETFTRGKKLYELSNHLGNVLAAISDKKVLVYPAGDGGTCTGGGFTDILNVYQRYTTIPVYKARQEINFLNEFATPDGDEWEAYIDPNAGPCVQSTTMPAGAYYVADLVSATGYK